MSEWVRSRTEKRTTANPAHVYTSSSNPDTSEKKKLTLASIPMDSSAPLDKVRKVIHIQAIHNRRRIAKMRRALRPEPDPDAADPELELELD